MAIFLKLELINNNYLFSFCSLQLLLKKTTNWKKNPTIVIVFQPVPVGVHVAQKQVMSWHHGGELYRPRGSLWPRRTRHSWCLWLVRTRHHSAMPPESVWRPDRELIQGHRQVINQPLKQPPRPWSWRQSRTAWRVIISFHNHWWNVVGWNEKESNYMYAGIIYL
jgi:hypothetical protein